MNIELMRSEISKVYPGSCWKTKVKMMSEAQVIAIYHNFLRNKKFKSSEIRCKHKQLTFDDILRGGQLK